MRTLAIDKLISARTYVIVSSDAITVIRFNFRAFEIARMMITAMI